MNAKKWQEIGPSEKDCKFPGPKGLELIAKAQAVIDSVPYRATLRFVFYRLWDAGEILLTEYRGKKADKPAKLRAYEKVKALLSTARHLGLMERDAMADDTREVTPPYTYASVKDWLASLKEYPCRLDPWEGAPVRPFVVFEAEAMLAQFEYWAEKYRVELWPFRGDPSIPYKDQLAERLSECGDQDAAILYFGDLDDKGEEIARDLGHVLQWSGIAKAYRVGLTQEQADAFGLEDNPEKPGTYQWESLSNEQAGQLITEALDCYAPDMAPVADDEDAATDEFHEALAELDGGDPAAPGEEA
jgi:hypothetical protein